MAPQVLLASTTSTGGMTNQRYNRVGDSPIIGAGTYANHLCAISCTGHGEHFIRCVAAHDIAKRLEYKYGYGSFQNNEKEEGNTEADGSALQLAVEEVVLGTLVGNCEEETGQGGVIAIDRDGNFIAKMNCPGMYHGWVYEDGEMETRIFREECMNDCTSS
jgi:beta-aspartyl-peptidase (threonine type)